MKFICKIFLLNGENFTTKAQKLKECKNKLKDIIKKNCIEFYDVSGIAFFKYEYEKNKTIDLTDNLVLEVKNFKEYFRYLKIEN